ncbi:MAG TPA: hypothetical protein VER96_06000 [Polyangiaceae bacterium]|nr:hypothetical protein [Polyangiaceae bacterium]
MLDAPFGFEARAESLNATAVQTKELRQFVLEGAQALFLAVEQQHEGMRNGRADGLTTGRLLRYQQAEATNERLN